MSIDGSIYSSLQEICHLSYIKGEFRRTSVDEDTISLKINYILQQTMAKQATFLTLHAMDKIQMSCRHYELYHI